MPDSGTVAALANQAISYATPTWTDIKTKRRRSISVGTGDLNWQRRMCDDLSTTSDFHQYYCEMYVPDPLTPSLDATSTGLRLQSGKPKTRRCCRHPAGACSTVQQSIGSRKKRQIILLQKFKQELTIGWLSQVRRLLPRIVFDQKGLKNILDGSIDMVNRCLL
jgi:hypothetical protein